MNPEKPPFLPPLRTFIWPVLGVATATGLVQEFFLWRAPRLLSYLVTFLSTTLIWLVIYSKMSPEQKAHLRGSLGLRK